MILYRLVGWMQHINSIVFERKVMLKINPNIEYRNLFSLQMVRIVRMV
jgi:hypothetical protein